jgi:sugar lactone lactonase YvrE
VARTTTILRDGFVFPEGLRWHDERLWVSDQGGGAVHTIGLDGSARIVVEVPGKPSGLGWLPDGRLLVVSMYQRRVLRMDGDRLEEHASLAHLPGFKLNELFVDQAGRAYVGDFGYDIDGYIQQHGQFGLMGPGGPPTTFLARIDPDGSVRVVADGLQFPNGCGLLPDGRTLIVAETIGMTLLAFDVDKAGNLTNRRVWAPTMSPWLRTAMRSDGMLGRLSRGLVRRAETGPLAPIAARTAFAPDGICVDAEGAVWVANAHGPECLRVARGGKVLERVHTGQTAYSCALGGPDHRTLFIATAPTFLEAEVEKQTAGRIEMTRVEVAGL